MRRIDLRTPDGWRSFDAMNGVILTLIPLILAGLYFTGFAPPMPSCSDAAASRLLV